MDEEERAFVASDLQRLSKFIGASASTTAIVPKMSKVIDCQDYAFIQSKDFKLKVRHQLALSKRLKEGYDDEKLDTLANSLGSNLLISSMASLN